MLVAALPPIRFKCPALLTADSKPGIVATSGAHEAIVPKSVLTPLPKNPRLTVVPPTNAEVA